MAMNLPSMKNTSAYITPEMAFQVYKSRNMCKIRLELRKEDAGMYLPFYVSMSYESTTICHMLNSDKMQTKTAKKETRMGNPDLQIFIQWMRFRKPLQM